MSTHSAVASVGLKKPLGVIQVPTITPAEDEVRVRVEWTASTPLDMHQNDGGLLVKHPQVLGDGCAGTIVEIGEGVKKRGMYKVGEKVFGFTWREQKEKAHQEFVTAPEWLFAKVCLSKPYPSYQFSVCSIGTPANIRIAPRRLHPCRSSNPSHQLCNRLPRCDHRPWYPAPVA